MALYPELPSLANSLDQDPFLELANLSTCPTQQLVVLGVQQTTRSDHLEPESPVRGPEVVSTLRKPSDIRAVRSPAGFVHSAIRIEVCHLACESSHVQANGSSRSRVAGSLTVPCESPGNHAVVVGTCPCKRLIRSEVSTRN